MGVTQYIGARYVPLFADPADWDSTRTYEPLTIVLHEGNSYTSKQFVPKGIDIANADFWAETGNYNAQVEQYRQEVLGFDERIEAIEDKTPEIFTAREIGLKNDNITDNTPILQAFLRNHINATILFDTGIYRFSPLEISGSAIATGNSKDYVPGFSLIGANFAFANPRMTNDFIDYETAINQDFANVTVFAPIREQEYIFNISVISNITLKNIMFTSMGSNTLYTINNAILKLHRCIFSLFENIHFCYVKGACIQSFNCYENRLLNSDFRICIANGNPALHGCFEFISGDDNPGVNSSAWNISNINFEGVLSHWFFVNDARVQNVTLSNIVGECYSFNHEGYTRVRYQHENFPVLDINHSLGVIGFYDNSYTQYNTYAGFTFESISIDNIGLFAFNANGEEWATNCIVSCANDCTFAVVINSVQLSAPTENCFIYSGSDELTGKYKSLICENINYDARIDADIKLIRGTLSYLFTNNGLTRTKSGRNTYIDPTAIMNLTPNIYLNSSRMYKESSLNNKEICRLSPIGTTEGINSAFCFSGIGVSKVVVVAQGNSNLTVKRVDSNLATLDTATKLTGSIIDVYTMNINEENARFSTIEVVSDGTNRDEIYNVIVS